MCVGLNLMGVLKVDGSEDQVHAAGLVIVGLDDVLKKTCKKNFCNRSHSLYITLFKSHKSWIILINCFIEFEKLQ